ncbi:hypothetical protein Tco_1296252, partial [Tanacetum coccineum]
DPMHVLMSSEFKFLSILSAVCGRFSPPHPSATFERVTRAPRNPMSFPYLDATETLPIIFFKAWDSGGKGGVWL